MAKLLDGERDVENVCIPSVLYLYLVYMFGEVLWRGSGLKVKLNFHVRLPLASRRHKQAPTKVNGCHLRDDLSARSDAYILRVGNSSKDLTTRIS